MTTMLLAYNYPFGVYGIIIITLCGQIYEVGLKRIVQGSKAPKILKLLSDWSVRCRKL